MKDDPAINAVREVRHRISELVQHDPRALVEYYRQLEERHRKRLVSQTGKQAPTQDDAA